jgi:G2/mitotic-specific cyclin 2
VVRLMLDYLARKEILHDAFFKKYAAKKFMKASIIVREWIRAEYSEEEFKDLGKDVKDDEDPDQENVPEDKDEEENQQSEVDDYMYADELEDYDVDG